MRDCPHRPPCDGCPRYGLPGAAPDVQASLDALAAAHGLPPVVVREGAPEGFRHRARLAIRGRKGAPKLGLFAAGTHEVVTVPNCVVHHPLVNEAAAIVRGALADAGVSPYSDRARLGVARYLQIVVERRSQTAQVVLVANTATPDDATGHALDMIRDRLDTRLHSLWFNAQTDTGNTILGPHFEHWHGPDAVVENFGGADVFYPPGAFGQSHLALADGLVASVRAHVPPGSRLAEFYAGVGAFGLSMLAETAELRLNEVAPASVAGLESGLARLTADLRARVTVEAGTAGERASMADGADVVLVDPPRRGLDPALLARLCADPPPRLLYVSCGLASLGEELQQLTADGRLQLRHLEAFDLMPYTGHVETLAVLERR